ncbi:MAG TPA: integrin alpha, partial [Kofleriaceae bacterium]|nr:integrin alpha [Kofleriaceae bacterium]
GALAIDLQFEDGSLQETAYVRLVVKSAAGFSAATLFRDEARDETVRNIDLDRDGTREIVADLGPKFAFNRRTSFLKLTSTGRTPTSVTLSAQGIDRFGNPVAVSDQLVSTLPGGKVTLSLKQCVAADCSGQRQVMVAMPRVLDVGGHAIAALAARGSTAEAPGLVAAGIPTSDGGDALFPNRGRVALLGPVDNDLMLAPAIEGAAAGDLFGAAVALGDVTGDGALDLVVGAPGITVAGAAPAYTAGRIYVIPGVSLATADLSTSLTFDGPTGGERLGSSLTLVDLDGDGVLDILAGAPAGDAGDAKGAVYALSAKTGRVTMLAVARGTTGAHLGGAVDALEGFIGSAAPGASSAYLWTPQELLSGSAPRLWSSQAGGGLGSSVVLCDIGADGTLDALASAPAGAGAIYSVKVPAESKSLGDADISHTITPGQTATAAGEGHLGAVLSRVPTRYGDAFLTTEAGVAYLITAAALDAAGPRLDPIAASAVIAGIQGAKPGAAFTSGVGANILVATPGVELLFGDNGGNLYVYSYAGSL